MTSTQEWFVYRRQDNANRYDFATKVVASGIRQVQEQLQYDEHNYGFYLIVERPNPRYDAKVPLVWAGTYKGDPTWERYG